jgi:hypothetical protein
MQTLGKDIYVSEKGRHNVDRRDRAVSGEESANCILHSSFQKPPFLSGQNHFFALPLIQQSTQTFLKHPGL